MKIAIVCDPSLINQIQGKEGKKSKESTENIQDDDPKPPLVKLQDASKGL